MDSTTKVIERVYLETNSLRGRWPGEISGELKVLAGLCRLTGVQLCIPDSAVVEHEHSILKHVQTEIDDARKKLKSANVVLNGLVPSLDVSTFDLEVTRQRHAEGVAFASERFGLQITPMTTKSVADFVVFAARQDAPFKKEDRGFRDAVHVHSVVEHLVGQPLSSSGEAVLISKDERLSEADVRDLARAAGVRLRVTTYEDVIHKVRAAITGETRQQLLSIANEWFAPFRQHAQEHLLPKLVEASLNLEIGRSTVIRGVFTAALSPDPYDFTVTPLEGRRYSCGADSYLKLHCVLERATVKEGSSTRNTYLSTIRLFIAVYASALMNDVGQPSDIKYDAARLFSVEWDLNKKDIEGLPTSIDLLGDTA